MCIAIPMSKKYKIKRKGYKEKEDTILIQVHFVAYVIKGTPSDFIFFFCKFSSRRILKPLAPLDLVELLLKKGDPHNLRAHTQNMHSKYKYRKGKGGRNS
jgi:hypothetical protein